jgi:hypothetical protein
METPSQAMVPQSAAVLIRRGLTAVVFVIASLSFAFGFGNGWLLGLALGVPGWIAPLVAPAVDLSVVALLGSLHYLRSRGLGGRLAGPRLLLIGCGVITFGLNTTRSVMAGAYGRACFDAIAPGLLIGWSEVGPRILASLHGTVPVDGTPVPDEDQSSVVTGDQSVPSVPLQPDRPAPSPEQIEWAKQLDQDHRQAKGRPITRDALRASLGVSNALAGEVLARVRGPPKSAAEPESL